MTESATTVPTVSRWRWNAAPAPSPAQICLRKIVKTRSFLVASLSYLAVLLLMFWPVLKGDALSSSAQTNLAPPFITPESIDSVPHVNSWTGDFVEQFSYFEEYQYRAAREGRFPTWNPHIFMGQPFHADGQSAMLHPSHWIYFLVDPNLARGPMAILRLWLSAIALFCLLRKFSLAPSASFAGGAIWALGSFNMHWLLWPQSNASLWVPVVLLPLDYLLVKPSWRSYAVVSLAIAPLFLSGHPGTEYLCFALIGIYVVIRFIGFLISTLTIRQLTITAGAVMGSGITGLFAAAAAVLPLYMQIRRSFEYLDTTGHRGVMEKIPWNSLWLFLIPEYFGRPRGAFPGFAYNGPDNYIEATMWFGALACMLALAYLLAIFLPRFGVSTEKWRDRFSFLPVFAITAFILSLLIVFCVWPVYQIVAAAPGGQLTSLRRFFLATQFAGAVLAACAIHQMLVRKDRTVAAITSIFAVTGCITVVHSILSRWDEVELGWMKSINSLPSQFGPNWPRVVYAMIEQFAGFRMMAGAVLLLISTVMLLCILVSTFRRREISPAMRYLFTALITLDVLLPAYDFNPVAPMHLVIPPTPEVLQSMILQTGDGRMIGTDWTLDPNISMQYNFRDVRGYDLPHSLRLAKLYKRLELSKFDNRGLLDFSRFYPCLDPKIEAYLDRTCVRSLMLFYPDPNAVSVLTAIKLLRGFESPGFMNWPQTSAPGNGIMIFSNPNSYPRTYFANTTDFKSNPDDAMDALLDNSTDLRDRSVYEGVQTPRSSATPTLAPDGTAAISQDKPEQIVIDAQTTAEHLLVLADRMDEGWKVTIDGKPAQALTANYLFRGVFVPAGHHTVEWTYHAPGLIAGVILSAVTVVAMIILLIGTTIGRKIAR